MADIRGPHCGDLRSSLSKNRPSNTHKEHRNVDILSSMMDRQRLIVLKKASRETLIVSRPLPLTIQDRRDSLAMAIQYWGDAMALGLPVRMDTLN